ncbi:transporter substrate-binding domain-containing protein [Falsochrobactrum sp. TDYN1]|uniref:Transporter substrate-binding domain-containing protein n=1 Tax=Falsochrobactrum tianjinense TaxID=2706015 RepID=A0A949PM70_9HYPH|nr:transporter substrate-binding domain-containing protein [Falsochrobactrum sp. TDYN1]MBV2142421.1 transporter substrate-binding domain-containing protein [Falsochrobactrum sp. TDYN1]
MKYLLLSIAVAFGWLLGSQPSQAQTDPRAPDFFNQKERLPLPSLQGVSRLRFLTTLDFPPFNMLNDAGQLSGYNVDLAKALCSQMGLNDICQIEAVPWDEMEDRLEKGGAEAIIAGLGPTRQNRKKLAFTRAYIRLPARFATTKAKTFKKPAATAVRGKNIGIIAGTAHEELLKSYFPQALAKPYPDRPAMLAALQKSEVEAVFDDGMALSFWLGSPQSSECCTFTDGPYLAPQYLGPGLVIAVSQENAPLAAAFNNALQALQEKGILTELYLRYFPTSFY